MARIVNTTNSPRSFRRANGLYVTVGPGESIKVLKEEEDQLGFALDSDVQEKEEEQEEGLASLLEGSVSDVEEALESAELTEDQLRELLQLERAGKDRKGVADAINEWLEAD